MLRHLLATLAYRTTRAIDVAPQEFAAYRSREGARTPLQILSHMSDLCEWALTMAIRQEKWRDAVPQTWEAEVSRFYTSLRALDDYLAGPSPISCAVSRLVQGPVADAITHVGQLTMLRRLSGNPTRGENFFRADIAPGQVGPNQPPPRRPFD
ncbi:MAG TPA: hypothetical protein VL126_14995 [Bacteroidota bacterium]|nr:hypothetical protein [Bacteroidota bacterium]